jgi:hypothetical protein
MKPLNILILVALPLLSLEWNTNAHSEGELPDAAEPQLAEEGDWAARYNEAQIECHEGSMKACDSIWMDDRVLMDTFLYNYGRTCGGRVDLRTIRREGFSCVEAFPGH